MISIALYALIVPALLSAMSLTARTARTARTRAAAVHADTCNRHVDTLAELSRRDEARARVASPAEARALRLIVAARFAASYCAHKR